MKKIVLIFTALIFIQILHSQSPAYPFPQHTTYTAGSIKPTVASQAGLDKVVKQFYNKWKTRYLVNGCEPEQYYVFYNYEGGADPSTVCIIIIKRIQV